MWQFIVKHVDEPDIFQQPVENLYKRRHIVLIFRLIILFWVPTRTCLNVFVPPVPSLLWLVSSHKPENYSPCLWSALLCFQPPVSFTSTINAGINYVSVWHSNIVSICWFCLRMIRYRISPPSQIHSLVLTTLLLQWRLFTPSVCVDLCSAWTKKKWL